MHPAAVAVRDHTLACINDGMYCNVSRLRSATWVFVHEAHCVVLKSGSYLWMHCVQSQNLLTIWQPRGSYILTNLAQASPRSQTTHNHYNYSFCPAGYWYLAIGPRSADFNATPSCLIGTLWSAPITTTSEILREVFHFSLLHRGWRARCSVRDP